MYALYILWEILVRGDANPEHSRDQTVYLWLNIAFAITAVVVVPLIFSKSLQAYFTEMVQNFIFFLSLLITILIWF